MGKITHCMFCSHALQCPDGCLRCSTDFKLAEDLCDEFEAGSPTLLKVNYTQPIRQKAIKLKPIKVKAVKPKKSKGPQASLF